MELIKKYQNRKLYSTLAKSYIGLDYIIDLVKTNQSFQVIENKSKIDITKTVLKSALSELDIDTATMVKLIRGE